MGNEIDIHAPGVEMRKSLCYFCHANCGVLAYVKDGEVIKIEGDPNYSNQGGLCCRGNSALLHLNHPARINHALKRVGKKGEGKWEKKAYGKGIELTGKTLGIVGFGRIGQKLGKMAKAIGMNVIAFDIFHIPGIEEELGIPYTLSDVKPPSHEDVVRAEKILRGLN